MFGTTSQQNSQTQAQQFFTMGSATGGDSSNVAGLGHSTLQQVQHPIHQTQQPTANSHYFSYNASQNDQSYLSENPMMDKQAATQPVSRQDPQITAAYLQQLTTGQFSQNSKQTAYLPTGGVQGTRAQVTAEKEAAALPSASPSVGKKHHSQADSKVYTELFVWGNDQHGQLGLGHKYLSNKPTARLEDGEPIPNTKKKILELPKSCSFSIQIRDVACGEDFAFLLTKKGLLYAMGSNQFGKLGILSPQNLQTGQPGHLAPTGQNQAADVPFASTPKLVESLAKHVIRKVACGLNHAVAVTEDSGGLCYSWGCGSHGQLGRAANNVLNLNPPAVVSYFMTRSIQVVDVAAGGKHTLFMTGSPESAVLAAGMNDFGQLGQGDIQQRLQKNTEPLEITGLNDEAMQIACGLVHSQILLKNGRVVSFGDNQFGQLGLGAEAGVQSTGHPTEIPSLTNVKAISCNHHSAAIGQRGELYFWGTGVFGTYFEPKVVVDADIIEVSVGGSFGIAKDKDGLLWTWGQNSNGELGLSDLKTRLYPHPILSLKRKQISKAVCGGSFAVAIGPDKRPGKTPGSPHRRKKSPFHNKESQLLKILQEKQQQQMPQHQTSEPILSDQQNFASQPSLQNNFENVRIFSAREQQALMCDSNGSQSKTGGLVADPSFSQLGSNPDVYSYFNDNGSTQNIQQVPGQQPFGNLHAQSQIFVKEGRHVAEPTSDTTGRRNRKSQSRGSATGAGRQATVNAVVKRLSGPGTTKRSVSPILGSQVSTQNLSSNPSFVSSSRNNLAHQQQSVQTCGFGGAVQAPRKKKSASRSKSGRPTRQGPTSQSHAAFVPVRSSGLASKGQTITHSSAQKSKANKLPQTTANTFELASFNQNINNDLSKQGIQNNSFGNGAGVVLSRTGNDSASRASSSVLNRSNSAKFPTAQPTVDKKMAARVQEVEQELYYMKLENQRLNAQVGRQNSNLVEMREQASSNQPGQVIDQLTDEVQKAHDLEYLLRNKERAIEILRGDVDEARALKLQAEENFDRVQAQNFGLLQDNEGLQEENGKLSEALEHAMRVCDQLKSQREEFSDRYGYLSNEVSSLRGLAKDLETQKNGGTGRGGFNTQKHTSKPSLVDGASLPPKRDSVVIQKAPEYSAYSDEQFSQVNLVSRVVNQRHLATLGPIPNEGEAHGIQKLEPILEEKYLQRAPETTKHADAAAMGDSSLGNSGLGLGMYVVQAANDSNAAAENVFSQKDAQSTVSGSFPMNGGQATINDNEQKELHNQGSSQQQQSLPYNETVGFSMQDLLHPSQNNEGTLEPADADKYAYEVDQDAQDSCDVTAVSETNAQNTNYDNKEVFAQQPEISSHQRQYAIALETRQPQAPLKTRIEQVDHQISRRQKSTTSSKSATKTRKRSTSKENYTSKPAYCSRQQNFTVRKSSDSAVRKRSTSNGKKRRSVSTGKTKKTVAPQSNVVVPEPVILNNQNLSRPQSGQSLQQINLTVESINKLEQIIRSEHQQLQQSINMGYDPSQGVQYVGNQNQADHSVLLRSPPGQAKGVQRINVNGQVMILSDVPSPQDQLHLDSSCKANNPMLTLSGHDIQNQAQMISNIQPVDSQQQNQNFQQSQFTNQLISEEYQHQNTFGNQESQQLPIQPSIDSAEEQSVVTVLKTTDKKPTAISKSVAKMQRDGLQLNRKPDLVAALRQSQGQCSNSVRNGSEGFFDRTPQDYYERESSSRQHSPIDIGPFRKSHLAARSASYTGGLNRGMTDSKSQPAVARKKETIDNFKSKLNRLEANKKDLENKMKLFDAKVNAHTATQEAVDDVESDY